MNERLKRKVWERDNYQCQHPGCGSTLLERVPHHIIFKSQGGKDEIDNLVTLCPGHHKEVHEGKECKYWRRYWVNWREERLGVRNAKY